MDKFTFEWDPKKDLVNQQKHGISFEFAQEAFFDPNRIVVFDKSHSSTEKRYFCFGRVNRGIVTVRFTHRTNKIRIFGAGYWRKGAKTYETENKIK